jgi:ParB family transcriptional regulator, chromosome partitioning protein
MSTASEALASLTVQVPITAIYESPTNPRKHFDESKLKELSDSIARAGILQPLLVREKQTDLGQFELIAGARRLRGAKTAGLDAVPARVVDMTDEQVLEAQIIENAQREDVHPLDEALGYRKLLETRPTYDVEAIAARVGKSETFVYQRLKLADLIPEAQKVFWAEGINAAQALQIARLQPKDQERALEACTGRGWIRSAKDLAEWIEREVLLDLNSAPFKKSDETLVPSAGSCTMCPKRTGFTPSLFPDIKKKDTCTDRSCFNAKLQVHVDRLRETRPDLAVVSGEWSGYGTKKAIPDRGDYSEVKPGTPGAKEVIVKDGTNAGKVITVSFHRSGGGSTKREVSIEQKIEDLRSKRDSEADTAAFHAGLQLVADSAVWPLSEAELRLVVEGYWGRVWHDRQVEILRRRGIERPKNTSAGEVMPIAEMSTDELAGLLLEMAIWSGFGGYDKALKQVADRLGLDLANAQKSARAEVKEKYQQRIEKLQKAAAQEKAKKASKKSATKKAKAGKR